MVDERKAMVESKSHETAGANNPPADDQVNLNGLGERRLQLADVVRFLGNEGVGEEVVRKLVIATERMASPDEQLPLIQPDLITLAEASQEYDIPISRLKGWILNGRLERKGRERFSAPGGGKVLVDREAVKYLKLYPPANGRPKKLAD